MGSTVAVWGSRVLRVWKRLQVSYYGGKYSIERVLALEAYTKNTSLLRVCLVCIATPMPLVLVVVAQELVPLQDPNDGWHANYGFWIRVTMLIFVGIPPLTVQATYFIDGVHISACRQILLSLCVSLGVISCALLIAARLIFPIPFFLVILTPVLYVVLLISFRLVVGKRTLDQMLSRRDKLAQFVAYISAKFIPVFLYPAYESLFHLSEGSPYQFFVILLLPLIKLALKNIMLRCTSHMEDMTPEAVIFTVDFFNAVYMATCMQSSTSATTVTIITVTDLTQTLIMLYGLHRRTSTILSKLNQVTKAKDEGLLVAICSLCRDPEKFVKQRSTGIHIRSCLPHILSDMDNRLLKQFNPLVDVAILPPRISPSTQQGTPWCACSRRRQKNNSTIYPVLPIQVKTAHEILTRANQLVSKTCSSRTLSSSRSRVLEETVKALFTTECLVISAYLESIIPLLYPCYVLAMVNLPNARFHSEMARVSSENVESTVLPVFMFGVLQVASLGVLVAVIKRNCGMQALHQLAFVLETQMWLIQVKWIFWTALTLCFRLVHFGRLFPLFLLASIAVVVLTKSFVDVHTISSRRCRLYIFISSSLSSKTLLSFK